MQAVLLCVAGVLFTGARAQGPVGRCGRNAHYSQSASVCPANCDNYGSAFSCQALAPGCECDNGYIFSGDQNSDCIPPNQCQNTEPPCGCGQNAHYSESASVCPATCKNKGQAFMCLALAPGCECDSGYVFADDLSSDCVAPSSCVPPVQRGNCGVNEEYSTCVNPCNDCETRGNCDFLVCNEGCDCKKGYYRYPNPNGICIPASECPSGNGDTCDVNEEYSTCVNPCNDCETRGNCNFLVCNKGCDCKNGFYRDTNGFCIPAPQCPSGSDPACDCGPNAHYSESASVCPATCKNMGQAFMCQAVDPGCECDSGYVFLDDQKNFCVAAKDCPPPASQDDC